MTLTNQTCPFDGVKINSVEFARQGGFSAIYNVSPIVPGHSLVIPKAHVERLFELSEEERDVFFRFAGRVTQLLLDVFLAKSFDWTLQDGEPAGQSVPHVHLHILPRHEADLPDPGDWYPRLELERQRMLSKTRHVDSHSRSRADLGDLDLIVKQIRSASSKLGLY